MNVATSTTNGPAVSESVYVVPGEVSADAITQQPAGASANASSRDCPAPVHGAGHI